MNNKLTEIAAELAQKRQALYQSVADLSQEQLDFRAEPGSWSAGEILHHLGIVETQVAKIIRKLIRKAQESGLGPDPADGSVLHCLDHFPVERVTQKAQAPPSAVPQAGLPKAELVEGLHTSRAALLEAVGQAAGYDLNQLLFPHPFFGDLNLYQWILLVGKHEHRHTGQIASVKAAPGFPPGGAAAVG